MKRFTVLAVVIGLIFFAVGGTLAQQAPPQPSQRGPGQPMPMQGGMCPMMNGGMMGGGMMGMGNMMGMMGGSGDPARMLQMRGEMMKAMGDIMMKYGKMMEGGGR